MIATLDNVIQLELAQLQSVSIPFLHQHNVTLTVLRLDKIHSLISGNKWFKLKYSLQDALAKNYTQIVTVGGAYSNHILATAAACQVLGLDSIGVIRGERNSALSCTLEQAEKLGMKLDFVSRSIYSNKELLYQKLQSNYPKGYLIEEGGMNDKGIRGGQDIMKLAASNKYTHICCAVGTGTMLAGITNALNDAQRVIGISSLNISNNTNNDLRKFLDDHHIPSNKYEIVYDYHFGGYAKYNDQLLDFMNEWYRTTSIPSDFVYTGKLFFAICDLIKKSYFAKQDSILIIHSGGLQGNCSLPKSRLLY